MFYLLDNAHANYLIFFSPSQWFTQYSIPFMVQALIRLLPPLFCRSSDCKTLHIPCPVCFIPPHANSAGRPLFPPAALIPSRERSPTVAGRHHSAPTAAVLIPSRYDPLTAAGRVCEPPLRPAVLIWPPPRPSLGNYPDTIPKEYILSR